MDAFVLNVYRYHAPYQRKYDDLYEAIESATWGFESGDEAFDTITDAEGNLIMDREALSDAVDVVDEVLFPVRTEPPLGLIYSGAMEVLVTSGELTVKEMQAESAILADAASETRLGAPVTRRYCVECTVCTGGVRRYRPECLAYGHRQKEVRS